MHPTEEHGSTGDGARLSTERRPRVLVAAGYFLPGFRGGGPIRSLANLIAALAPEFGFRLLAWDRDLGDDSAYDEVPPPWSNVGGAAVRYLAPGRGAFRAIAKLLHDEEYDVLYLQTFFDPHFGLWPLMLRRLGWLRPARLVIAPRGQFSPGALNISSGRKQVVLRLARLLLRGDELWQATAPEEVSHIRACFPSARVILAPNVPSGESPPADHRTKSKGWLRVVFISRISPKKNLLGAIRAFGGVRGEVTFDIFGPIEDHEYWSACEQAITSVARPGLSITHRGDLPPDMVGQTFSAYDVFLFPTHGENFGHVIMEALLAGCPCLLSDQTPWRALRAVDAGWDLSLSDMSAFTDALQWCADASDSEMARMSAGARDHARRYLASDSSIAATRLLLNGASAVVEQPR